MIMTLVPEPLLEMLVGDAFSTVAAWARTWARCLRTAARLAFCAGEEKSGRFGFYWRKR